ncbi:WGR and DUF4132 domain-containing protein [Chitinibacter sp. GC72]|uniref:WGR and DUF4132 domain-containing protein n=1 Tax=Chitinibacter sp. GC72 TaxID=1526917 RepID=UPI0012FB20B6|nr:DUF4132 domain-containing protein [Chitinibacter sp. GC72]
MQRYEYTEGNSSKFWEIEQDGLQLNIRWGRIGTNGQSQTKDFASADKASTAMEKLIKEKTGKGYTHTGDIAVNNIKKELQQDTPEQATEKSITVNIAAPQAATPPSQPERGSTPPWLSIEYIALTPEMRQAAHPNRQNPGQPLNIDPEQAWQEFASSLEDEGEDREKLAMDVQESGTAFASACNEAFERIRKAERHGSPQSDAVLLAFSCNASCFYRMALGGNAIALVRYLLGHYGLLGAIDILIEAEQIHVERDWDYSQRVTRLTLSRQVDGTLIHGERFCPGEMLYRTALAQASESDWQAAAERLQAAAPLIHPARRVLLAALLPECPEFANSMALELANSGQSLTMLATVVTSAQARKAVRQASNGHWYGYYADFPATVIQQHGDEAVALLEALIHHDTIADMIARIGTPEAITALAKVASQSKANQARFVSASQRWPLAAIPAIAELLIHSGKDAGLFSATLTTLAQAHPAALEQVWHWLSAAAQGQISELLARFTSPTDVASTDELPRVLVSPPWLSKKKAAIAALELDVLPLPPVEQWAEDEKEQARAVHEWQAKRFEEAAKDATALADELGFGRVSHQQSENRKAFQGILQSAVHALQQHNGASLIEAWKNYKAAKLSYWMSADTRYLTLLPEAMALQVWPSFAVDDSYRCSFFMATYGLKALDGLLACVQQRPAAEIPLAMHYGWSALAPAIARAYVKLKTARASAREWLLAYPEHAITGLLPNALGKAGEARDCAGTALRLLASHGHAALMRTVAQRYERADVLNALQAVLDEDPLDRYPAKIGKNPAFWQPQGCRRPVLLNGKALPDSALEHLGCMLRFPTTEGIYPGIEQVKAACQPQSLADFAWDGFNQWLFAAAPSKENWAFSALGLLGTDDTARKLNPLIRAWPGEAQHARAVAGLDVLATIGSDVALMLLNGIAQKVKFKGLQDRAREKIAAIAEARELTTEELEDRLAPDLGLDEMGTLQLDFGPRQFIVGFDETLKPYVRDTDGVRLKDLPKPNAKDDAELAKAAVDTYKQLKKDAKTVASQQVQRLEVAMCTRRRWPVDVFVQFLATHPLVRHLVQRLVWGVYTLAGEGRYGGELQATFRVAEDGSYTDANDDEFTLPAGEIRIGLPHALEMPADDGAAFAQLFADYELLQPFAQLGRDKHSLKAQEAAEAKLLRWKDRVVPTGKIFGLSHRGWRRGEAQDGGGIWYYTKEIGDGRLIELTFDPGIIVGMTDEYPEQKLQELVIAKKTSGWHQDSNEAFATLDPITASELIRDMEMLVG